MGKRITSRKKQSRQESCILNSQRSDSGGKLIFEDNILCCQFLNGYVSLPYFESVRPEDIEDISSEFTPMFAEERHADRIKKIKMHTGDKKVDFFLISLVEHKTQVDYNIHMQIFRYMIYIWERYAKECEKTDFGCTRRKGFQYPPIIPIVYYEGKGKWTAPEQFKDKIIFGEQFEKYLPNFTYYIVPIHQYSNETLVEHGDEISLIMLLNRMQTAEDIEEFRKLPAEKLDAILKDTPDYLLDIIARVFRAFLLEENVSEDETDELVGKVKERHMARLFENMDKIDMQAERRNTQKERERAERAEKKAEEALEKGIKELVTGMEELGASKECVIKKLCIGYEMQESVAEEKVECYWRK